MLPPTQNINSSSAFQASANWNLATGQNVPTREYQGLMRTAAASPKHLFLNTMFSTI